MVSCRCVANLVPRPDTHAKSLCKAPGMDLGGKRIVVVGGSAKHGWSGRTGGRAWCPGRGRSAAHGPVGPASSHGAGQEPAQWNATVRDPHAREMLVERSVGTFAGLDAVVYSTAVDPLCA